MDSIDSRVESLIALAHSKTETKPVLWYFSHLYGRSEIVRMTLHFAGVDFVFAGFSNAEWTAIKAKIFPENEPNWGLPTLQIDGCFLSQTKSIVRYVGQKYNLYPSEAMDTWRVESILEGADDLFAKII
jgi:glutathione S-transferase